ncbi:MAG: YebC/PmpR family DNA-binding transcriptional regulator [Candidatus Yanofskybacteria bacterium]|nr:YebC/PmpR family DNA-binding transcriptional regulator [Candidatus Yanofskybacteria bacterium]
MSGHSKWSQIKHKKGISDQKRSAEFGKLAQAITIAARDNPDPKTNARLKTAIEKARSLNMPNDNIERAIKRTADKSQGALEELVIELMAPGNIACIVTAITDSRNRTLAEIRAFAHAHGARIVNPGSLLWMFHKTIAPDGIAYVPNAPMPLEPATEKKLETFLSALDDLEDIQDVFINA